MYRPTLDTGPTTNSKDTARLIRRRFVTKHKAGLYGQRIKQLQSSENNLFLYLPIPVDLLLRYRFSTRHHEWVY